MIAKYLRQSIAVICKTPALILLLIVVQLTAIIGIKSLPNIIRLLDYFKFYSVSMEVSNTLQYFDVSNDSILYFLKNIVVLQFISFISFLLIPVVIARIQNYLKSDEMISGTYISRGLRKHWWKVIIIYLVQLLLCSYVVFGIFILANLFSKLVNSDLALASFDSEAHGIVLLVFTAFIFYVYSICSVLIQSVSAFLLALLADNKVSISSIKKAFTLDSLQAVVQVLAGSLILYIVPLSLYFAIGMLVYYFTDCQVFSYIYFVKLWDFTRSWPGTVLFLLVSIPRTFVFPHQLFHSLKATTEMSKNQIQAC